MREYFLLFIAFLKYCLILCLLIFSGLYLNAQIIRVVPDNPSPDDSISIFFYADQGNKALENYDGDVYMHTAVITGSADEPSSWRYIQGEWGQDDFRVKMRKVKPNVYRKDMHIRSFYRLGISEPFLQLVFVFRNLTGSIVATPLDAEEVYYPSINVLRALDLSQASGKDGQFLRNYQSHRLNENNLLVAAEGGDINLSFFENQIARITFFPEKEQTLRKSKLAIESELKKVKPVLTEKDSTIECSWSNNAKVIIQKFPLRLSWYLNGGKVLEDRDGFFKDEEDYTLGIRSNLQPSEKIYGLGVQGMSFNRRKHRFYLYHKDEENYEMGDSPLNMALPHIISSAGYSLLVDNTKKAYWDLEKTEEGISEYAMRGTEQLTYFLILSSEPKELVQKMSTLTGKQPLPPFWAFGYIHSTKGDVTQKKLGETFEYLQTNEIPLEAFVLEEGWEGANSERGNFKWNGQVFPSPTSMMNAFRARGVKTVLGTSPYILSFSENFGELASRRLLATSSSGSPYVISDFKFGQAALLDIFHPEASSWLWQKFEPLLAQGVDGWFSKEIEPSKHPYNILHRNGSSGDLHNQYGRRWSESLDRQYQTGLPGRRLFHLASSGNIGMQKYRVFPYSGNPAPTWEGMKIQTGIMLSVGLSAIPYMHSKIKGSDELGKRWGQLGVFSPIMFGEGDINKMGEHLKAATALRYQFLPYNYSLAWEHRTKGLPLARPMFFEMTDKPFVWELDDQFLWGRQMIVAPILEEGKTARKVYVPLGVWFDFWSGEIYNNGWHTVSVEDAQIPLLVRAGAIIPLIPTIRNTSEFKGDSFIFRFYPHIQTPISSYEWYLDDGEDPKAIESQNFRLVTFNAEASKSKLNISWNVQGNGYQNEPDSINCIWEVYHINSDPKLVKWANKKLNRVAAFEEFKQTPNSFYWEDENKRLLIHVIWRGQQTRLFIKTPKWSE